MDNIKKGDELIGKNGQEQTHEQSTRGRGWKMRLNRTRGEERGEEVKKTKRKD